MKKIAFVFVSLIVAFAPLTPAFAQTPPVTTSGAIRQCSDSKNKGQKEIGAGVINLVDQYLAIGYTLEDVCQESDSTISALIYRQDEPNCEVTKNRCDTEMFLSFRSDKTLSRKVVLNKSLSLIGVMFPNFCFIDKITSGSVNNAYVVCGNGESGAVSWQRVSRTSGAVTIVKNFDGKKYVTPQPSILKQFRTQQSWY